MIAVAAVWLVPGLAARTTACDALTPGFIVSICETIKFVKLAFLNEGNPAQSKPSKDINRCTSGKESGSGHLFTS